MAEHGFDATLLDISEVGLQIAREEADARGLHIATVCADLEEQPLPTGPWHVILSFHYLQRSLITQFATQLAPGGVLFFVQPTVRNLERHDRPSQRFLLEEGELITLAQRAGLEAQLYEEGWSEEGRHEALLIATAGAPSTT